MFGMQDRVPPFPTEDALLVMQNGALLALASPPAFWRALLA